MESREEGYKKGWPVKEELTIKVTVMFK